MHSSAWLFLAGTFVPSILAAADRPASATIAVEEIVARVNGEIITRGEFDKLRLQVDALRDRIDAMLLAQKGKELNINVDAELNRMFSRMQSESGISDPDKFRGLIREQFGETYEDLRLTYKNRLIGQRVISEEVYRNIVIPKTEINKYYNEHKTEFIRQETVSLREILISTGDGTAEQVAAAERKAKGLVERAKKGEAKFTDLARQYSDAPTATSGGELGAFRRGDLAKEIDEAVFTHPRGYITDPIRRPAGFEIYRVEEHYAAGQASEDEVEPEINARLIEPRAYPKTREYLAQLRQDAFLQIKEGYVDSGAAPGKDTSWQDPAAIRPETTTKEAVAAHARKKFLKVIPYGHPIGAPLSESQRECPAPWATDRRESQTVPSARTNAFLPPAPAFPAE